MLSVILFSILSITCVNSYPIITTDDTVNLYYNDTIYLDCNDSGSGSGSDIIIEDDIVYFDGIALEYSDYIYRPDTDDTESNYTDDYQYTDNNYYSTDKLIVAENCTTLQNYVAELEGTLNQLGIMILVLGGLVFVLIFVNVFNINLIKQNKLEELKIPQIKTIS